MTAGGKTLRLASGCSALALLAATPIFAAGFGIFEQGSKAMGMAGAFTAQADDPSAMFHNVGGLGHTPHTLHPLGMTKLLLQLGIGQLSGIHLFL